MNEEKLTIRISPAFIARIDALRAALEREYPHARKGRAGAARILLDEAMARREARDRSAIFAPDGTIAGYTTGGIAGEPLVIVRRDDEGGE